MAYWYGKRQRAILIRPIQPWARTHRHTHTRFSLPQRAECVKLAAHLLSPRPASAGCALWKVTNVVWTRYARLSAAGLAPSKNSSDPENFCSLLQDDIYWKWKSETREGALCCILPVYSLTVFIIIKAHVSFISTAVILFKRGTKRRTISATVRSTCARFGWLFTKLAANASMPTSYGELLLQDWLLPLALTISIWLRLDVNLQRPTWESDSRTRRSGALFTRVIIGWHVASFLLHFAVNNKCSHQPVCFW